MTSRLRCFGNGDFALKVERLLTSNRTKQDRTVEFRSEEFDAHIHFADVDESPRPQLVTRISVAVRPQRFFSVHTGGHIAPMRRWNSLSRNRLNIEDIYSVRCAADEIVHTLKCR